VKKRGKLPISGTIEVPLIGNYFLI
jgi:hypothetical protein